MELLFFFAFKLYSYRIYSTIQLDAATANLERATRERNTFDDPKSGSSGSNKAEYDGAVDRSAATKQRLQTKTENDTACQIMQDVLRQIYCIDQVALENVLNNDYIKKLVFYICSVMPLYKGTQEILLNSELFDLFDVVVDYFHLN